VKWVEHAALKRVNWVRRLVGSYRDIWKMLQVPTSFSVSVGGFKRKAQARCCHWLSNNATFTTTVVPWPQAHSKRGWAPQTAHRDTSNRMQSEKLNSTIAVKAKNAQLLPAGKCSLQA